MIAILSSLGPNSGVLCVRSRIRTRARDGKPQFQPRDKPDGLPARDCMTSELHGGDANARNSNRVVHVVYYRQSLSVQAYQTSWWSARWLSVLVSYLKSQEPQPLAGCLAHPLNPSYPFTDPLLPRSICIALSIPFHSQCNLEHELNSR